jgi:hypothetical protein
MSMKGKEDKAQPNKLSLCTEHCGSAGELDATGRRKRHNLGNLLGGLSTCD